jgi:uncharacterized metal-binding protein YceD (DUF177 family)
MSTKTDIGTPEFSRLISVEGITPDKVREESVRATAEECKALAGRFDLRHLLKLEARLKIHRVAGGTAIRVAGDIEAEMVQACVVSLQDVASEVAVHFETFFSEEAIAQEGEIELDLGGDENNPEMVHDGQIDMGEVVAQYFSLEINPYPRAPGVSLAAQMAESGVKVKPGPFAVLETLKKDQKS